MFMVRLSITGIQVRQPANPQRGRGVQAHADVYRGPPGWLLGWGPVLPRPAVKS